MQALSYFSTLLQKLHDFRGKGYKVCVLIFWTTFVRNISYLKPIQLDITINVHRSSCNRPLILVRFLSNPNFPHRFSKNTQISNYVQISPEAAGLIHGRHRQQEGLYDEANSRFLRMRPKIEILGCKMWQNMMVEFLSLHVIINTYIHT